MVLVRKPTGGYDAVQPVPIPNSGGQVGYTPAFVSVDGNGNAIGGTNTYYLAGSVGAPVASLAAGATTSPVTIPAAGASVSVIAVARSAVSAA